VVFIYAVTTLFKVEGTMQMPLKTAIANFVASTVYGLALPLVLKALTAKTSVTSPRMSMAPAMKPFEDKDDEDKLP
jgi:hypothetical protein